MPKDTHHIVPQFYLRNFANGVGRKARFVAFERETGRSFGAVVRDVAAVRHFNRIKTDDDTDPDALENALAEIEGEWAPLIAEVIDAGVFPSTLHREAVLTLSATLSLRSGRFREAINNLLTETATKMMDARLATKERWEAAHPDEDFPYEELKRFWDSREFDRTFEQTYFIARELEAIGPVYELLNRRNWCYVRPAGANRFITSDDPTVLHWTEERDRGFWHSPGHGVAETALTFPLSPELLVFGTFEPQPPQNVASTSRWRSSMAWSPVTLDDTSSRATPCSPLAWETMGSSLRRRSHDCSEEDSLGDEHTASLSAEPNPESQSSRHRSLHGPLQGQL